MQIKYFKAAVGIVPYGSRLALLEGAKHDKKSGL